ncbi:hypothetical protein [Komagataeibacter sp. FNDCF1]|uniref:hypothetical protein n=1 Tax=Komagataeibacter sp. FNDCF1 TaxID=2878681 RepID=UPI001E46DBCA|nr:hypothetical protein [Komagataeibacter sp. FNDCF1]MCE2565045.1 hypothetical protein [Komagataeibacter sp. FNDCF1]
MPSINVKKLQKRTDYELWKWNRSNSKIESPEGIYQMVGWYLHGREIDPPGNLRAADPAIELHVRAIQGGAVLVLTKDPNGFGAMFAHGRRVTFHET